MNIKKKWLAIICVFILIIGISVYFYLRSKDDSSAQSYAYPPVKVALVKAQTQVTPRLLSGIGELEAIV